jgi:UDP-N-acetylmuramyl pentapeptide phosphotransferase/UDP-N-acetylglucosamine-1-phosphate transferase
MTATTVSLSVLLATFVASWLIVATTSLHGRLSLDSAVGIQKVHTIPAPRIGGLALVVGAFVGWLTLTGEAKTVWAHVCLCMVPAFVSGLVEDLTKHAGVTARLLGTLASGALIAVTWTPFGLDPGIAAACAIVLTAVSVGGSANAFNIIDGVNGLAAGTGLVVSVAFAVVASEVNDVGLFAVCSVIVAALGGFLFLNFPRGLLFLGDAGAYVTGGVVAAVAVALPVRHVEVTPLFGILALSYPVIETAVSIQRRLRRRRGTTTADRLHLHSLVYRSLALRLARAGGRPALRNPLTAIVVGALPVLAALWAVAACRSTPLSLLGLVVVATAYLGLYRRVTRFGR